MARPFKSEASKKAALAKRAKTLRAAAASKPALASAAPSVATAAPSAVSVISKASKAKLVKLAREARELQSRVAQITLAINKLAQENLAFLKAEKLVEQAADIAAAAAYLQKVDLDKVAVWDLASEHVIKSAPKAVAKKRSRSKKAVSALPVAAPVSVDAPVAASIPLVRTAPIAVVIRTKAPAKTPTKARKRGRPNIKAIAPTGDAVSS